MQQLVDVTAQRRSVDRHQALGALTALVRPARIWRLGDLQQFLAPLTGAAGEGGGEGADHVVDAAGDEVVVHPVGRHRVEHTAARLADGVVVAQQVVIGVPGGTVVLQPAQPVHQQLAQTEVSDEVPLAARPPGVFELLRDLMGGQAMDTAQLVMAQQDIRAFLVMRHRQMGEEIEPLVMVIGRKPHRQLVEDQLLKQYVRHRALGGAVRVVQLGVQDGPVVGVRFHRVVGGSGGQPDHRVRPSAAELGHGGGDTRRQCVPPSRSAPTCMRSVTFWNLSPVRKGIRSMSTPADSGPWSPS
ncbi:hypothetical protein ACFZCU_39185 [Streptomyces canus]|uniref:hypothetical protein n=1 Tax=Streptomyces canus TaxID=58343 RepID=UPI0036E2F347